MAIGSPHIRVTAEEGTATLWLDFPGPTPNALDLTRLRRLDAALAAVASNCSLHALVVRSARPDGFCTGLSPRVQHDLSNPSDRAAFSWYMQQVFDRLASLDLVSIALIEGPCLDAGFELALACDYRIAVCRPDTRLGFPTGQAYGGGSIRVRQLLGKRGNSFMTSGGVISGREALHLKLVDIACCQRRQRIELRTLLDRLDRRPVKPRRAPLQSGFAAERRRFAAAGPMASDSMLVSEPVISIPPLPDTIGLASQHPEAARTTAAAATRGHTIIVGGNRAPVCAGIDDLLARGFVTPLEAEQARGRVRLAGHLNEFRSARLLLAAPGENLSQLAAKLRHRTLVGVVRDTEPRQDRNEFDGSNGSLVGRCLMPLRFGDRNCVTIYRRPGVDADSSAVMAGWLSRLGRNPTIVMV